MEYETGNRILSRARARIRDRNQNYLLVIIGKPGEGKSWAALRIAHYLDPTFDDNVEERVCFEILKMVKLIRQKRVGKGNVLVMDEAGISFGTRDSMTIVNKQISALLQAWRMMNCGLIMTLPDLTFLDLHGRKMCDAVFHASKLYEKKGFCKLRIHDSKNNPYKGSITRPHPTTTEGGEIIRHKWMSVGKPTKDVRERYEVMKEEFTDRLFDRMEKTISNLEMQKINLMVRKMDKKKQARKMFKDGMKPKEIAKELDVTDRAVQKWVKDIR